MAGLSWWTEDPNTRNGSFPGLLQHVESSMRPSSTTFPADTETACPCGSTATSPSWFSFHLRVKHRLSRYPPNMSRMLGRAILGERDGHLRWLAVMTRALSDGACARFGIGYPVDPVMSGYLRCR